MNFLQAWKLQLLARRLRNTGNYHPSVRKILVESLRLSPTPKALMDYTNFLRDQGKNLPKQFSSKVKFAQYFYTFRWKKCRIQKSIILQQKKWRTEFSLAVLNSTQAKGICVVGNSALLLHSNKGEKIDQHSMIVRFNQCLTLDPSISKDTGINCDLWIGAPNYRGPIPRSTFTAISGPDMAFVLNSWSFFSSIIEQNIPILSIPLEVWRSLVLILNAPPSSGILTLAWLKRLNGSWNGISFVGIGDGVAVQSRYHLMLPLHPPSIRHNWKAEQQLIALWQKEGLCRI